MRPYSLRINTVLFGLSLLCSFGLAGCEQPASILKNAGPAVLLVAARPDLAESEGSLAIDLYIRDLERDPVDLQIWVWRASGDKEPATVLHSPGHGTRGLNAEPQQPGAWHRIYIDMKSLPETEEVFVEVDSVDSRGNPGAPTATDPFKRGDGWTIETSSPELPPARR